MQNAVTSKTRAIAVEKTGGVGVWFGGVLVIGFGFRFKTPDISSPQAFHTNP